MNTIQNRDIANGLATLWVANLEAIAVIPATAMPTAIENHILALRNRVGTMASILANRALSFCLTSKKYFQYADRENCEEPPLCDRYDASKVRLSYSNGMICSSIVYVIAIKSSSSDEYKYRGVECFMTDNYSSIIQRSILRVDEEKLMPTLMSLRSSTAKGRV